MKKLLRSAILGTAMIGAGVAAPLVMAGPASALPGNGNGATVERNVYPGTSCGFYDSVSGSVWIVIPCTVNRVTTPNGNVTETLNGRVNTLYGGSPLPTSAMHWSDTLNGPTICDILPTGQFLYGVYNVTPTGIATATCRLTPQP
jgi:hypothetical protein